MDYEKIIKYFLLTMFVIYMFLYVINKSGYYNSKIKRNAELTENEILEFEKDIRDNKDISPSGYIKNNIKDYSNFVSTTGYKISTTVDRILNKELKKIYKFAIKFVT